MTTIATIAAARRLKWEYQQLHQTPRILHFPRGPPRRKVPRSRLKKLSSGLEERSKLEALFDQERSFSKDSVPTALLLSGGETCRRRERVEIGESRSGDETVVGMVEEEKWKFQADVLRAECILLRTEREMAVMKMEQTKVQTEKALRSAVEILTSGRLKICEGMNAKVIIEEAIEGLAGKLEKSGNMPAAKKNGASNSKNLDKHSNRLKKKLLKFAEMGEIQETQANAPVKPSRRIDQSFHSSDGYELIVDLLRTKMADLSISSVTLLEKMKEELGIRPPTACSSTSYLKRIEFFDSSRDTISTDNSMCSRRCREIIRRIIEQVGEETEQWSQMEEMLSRVREEIEDLRNSRAFWENLALDRQFQIQSLHSDVEEWRNIAISSKSKEDDLQKQISILNQEIERLKFKNSSPRNDAKAEKVKRVNVCRSKENHRSHFPDGSSSSVSKEELSAPRRLPMGDIGNRGMTVRRDMKLIPCSRHETRED